MQTMIDTDHNQSIHKAYINFIDTRKSTQTKVKYTRIINDFMIKMFNKKIIDVSREDLASLKYSIVYQKFIKPERSRGIKDSTIKISLNIISSFFDFVDKEEIFPEIDLLKVRARCFNSNSLENDIEHIRPMSKKDLETLKGWLKNRTYKSKDRDMGIKYAALVDFMFVTAIRSSAVFKIKWKQFDVYDSSYGGKFVDLKEVDKGSKHNVKTLSFDYYQNIYNLLYRGNDNNLVFEGLNKRNLINYMQIFSNQTGIHITPHSIKVGAGTYVYSITKDLVKTSRFLDHDSVETTMRYIRENGNPNEKGSVIASQIYDYSKLDNMSKEDLLHIIKSRVELETIIYSDAVQTGLIKI